MLALILALAGPAAAEQTDDDEYKAQVADGNIVRSTDQKLSPSAIIEHVGYQLNYSNYKVSAKMPKVPANANVHKTIPVNVLDSASIANNNISKAFRFTESERSPVFQSSAAAQSVMTMDAKGRSIEYFTTGAVVYMEGDIFSEKAPDLLASNRLSTKDAKATFSREAMKFLTTNNLAKNTTYLREVSFATLQEYDVTSRKVVDRKVVGAAVHYGYTIDGIKAYGPGAKVSVLFDSDKRIIGYIDTLRQHKPTHSVALIDPQEAVDRYINYGEPKTLLRAGGGIVKEVLIDSVELVYYLDAVSKKQDEIRPHYLIRGRFVCENPDGNELRSVKFEWKEDAVAG
jgi:hypothetical protein